MAQMPPEEQQPESTTPQAMTPAQNMMLTIKLLTGAGALIALFWFIDRAIS